MNNSLYMIRNRRLNRKLDQLIKDCNLDLCYQDRKEKIFKGDEFLISLKRKYMFLYSFSDDISLIPKIQRFLRT